MIEPERVAGDRVVIRPWPAGTAGAAGSAKIAHSRSDGRCRAPAGAACPDWVRGRRRCMSAGRRAGSDRCPRPPWTRSGGAACCAERQHDHGGAATPLERMEPAEKRV